jgi:DNA-binding CsgD family transcriptional regulator
VRHFSVVFADAFCGIWVEASTKRPTAVSCPEVAERLQDFDYASGDDMSLRARPATHPVGEVATFSADAIDGGRLYREVFEPAGFAPAGFHVSLSSDATGVSTTFYVYPKRGRDDCASILAQLELLMPWLLHATRTTIAAQRAVKATEVLRRSLDRLRIGVVLLDELATVVFANRSAASLLEGAPSKSYDWYSADPERRRVMSGALDRLLEHEAKGAPRVLLSRIDLAADGVRPFEGRVHSAMLIADPDGAPVPSAEALRERFGLTPAEAKLAVLLASGLSLDEAAERLRVTVGTVRTRIKQVFAKTETNRQAGLVRLLLTEAAPVRDE